MSGTDVDSVDWTDVDADLRTRLRDAFDRVYDPCSIAHGVQLGLVEMGLVKVVRWSDDGALAVELRLTSPFCEMVGYFTREVENQCAGIPAVSHITVTFDRGFDWSAAMMTPDGRERRDRRIPISPVTRTRPSPNDDKAGHYAHAV